MQRVGPFRVDFDRMVLVTFRYDDDKYSLYQGRESLRNLGIRVSDDLTKAQRTQLKSAKNRGVIGYFYKGKFFERENTQKDRAEPGQSAPRVFKRATRRVTPAHTLDVPLILNMKPLWTLTFTLIKE